MPRRREQPDTIPHNFDTLEEFWDFWDNHSLADYGDSLHPVECHVNLVRRTRMVPIEPDLLDELAAYAESRGVSCETLINVWLRADMTSRSAKV